MRGDERFSVVLYRGREYCGIKSDFVRAKEKSERVKVGEDIIKVRFS